MKPPSDGCSVKGVDPATCELIHGGCVGRDTRDKQFAVTAPVSPDVLKLKVNAEKIDKAMSRLGAER